MMRAGYAPPLIFHDALTIEQFVLSELVIRDLLGGQFSLKEVDNGP